MKLMTKVTVLFSIMALLFVFRWLFVANEVSPALELNAPVPSELDEVSIEDAVVAIAADEPNLSSDKHGTELEEDVDINNTFQERDIPGLAGGQNTPKLNYEDDWCNPYIELSPSDFERSQQETNEFLLSRGGANINIMPHRPADIASGLRNNVYVESYQEMPLEDLRQLSRQGDRMAMITLVQRNDAESTERNEVARELLIQGDTQHGLARLVSNQMTTAALRFKETGSADEEVRMHLLMALALVEYGMQRKDLHALSIFLTYAGKKDYLLLGLDPEVALSDEELQQVPQLKDELWHGIDNERLANNLPSLEEEEIPRMAYKQFENLSATLYAGYPDYFADSRVGQLWREEYLQKSQCTENLIGVYTEQLRALNPEFR